VTRAAHASTVSGAARFIAAVVSRTAQSMGHEFVSARKKTSLLASSSEASFFPHPRFSYARASSSSARHR